jgi:hypothetical protein
MSQPTIINPIRLNGRRYRKGDEAALQALTQPEANPDQAVSQEQLAQWQKRGLIEGDWGVEASATDAAPNTEEVERLQSEIEGMQRTFDASYGELQRERDALAARVAELEAAASTPTNGSTPADEGANTDTFEAALRAEFGDRDSATVLKSEYATPAAILGTEAAELNKLSQFGDAKVERLRAVATRFAG